MLGIIQRYRAWLDLPDIAAVTLGEGGTPLVPWAIWGETEVFLKLEGTNPTGSFKDRGMTVAVSVARHEGALAVICASTGNTAASAAAYAGRAGMKSFVVIPEGKVTAEKMVQASAHGAQILSVKGNFDEALMMVRQIAAQSSHIALVNSVNPWRLRGQETGAFEIADHLGGAPKALVLPVGNAGNISAYFQGFRRYGQGIPMMIGIQALGANPMVQGHDIDEPETVASAIRIGRPASRHLAEEAVQVSQGQFLDVSDAEILRAQEELAHGGIFVEPASAAAYAGLKTLHGRNALPKGQVVGILTGSGLKDGKTPLNWITSSPIATDSQHIGAAIDDLLEGRPTHVAY